MNKETLQSIVDDLRAGRTPRLSPEDFPCFGRGARGQPTRGPVVP